MVLVADDLKPPTAEWLAHAHILSKSAAKGGERSLGILIAGVLRSIGAALVPIKAPADLGQIGRRPEDMAQGLRGMCKDVERCLKSAAITSIDGAPLVERTCGPLAEGVVAWRLPLISRRLERPR